MTRSESVPAAVLPLLHGVMVLSAFHGSQLPAHTAPYEFRTANGLDPAAIRDVPNELYNFIHARR